MALAFASPVHLTASRSLRSPTTLCVNRSPLTPRASFDYDLAVVGAGVGGHGAVLHAVSNGLKVVLFEAQDVGGTCVNRGCVPSKALLAVAGRMREMSNREHLGQLGIQVGDVAFDRQSVASHANGLAEKVKNSMGRGLEAMGVDIVRERAVLEGQQLIKGGGKTYSAKDIILAPGSVPFVPRGIELDGKTVFTSDEALKMEWVPDWVAIVGSGYIGLEFSDVYTALGSDVTFIEAMPNLMPGFDPEIARLAQRLLINSRPINFHTNVFASKVIPGVPGKKPVRIEMIDAGTKKQVDELEVDAAMIATGRSPNTRALGLESIGVEVQRGFVPVDEYMHVLKPDGTVVEHVYAIGDANGKMMLAHAASAQGISAVENIMGNRHAVDHEAVPAACFTHPEISMVGLDEPKAKERAKQDGFELGKSIGHFRANSKALAEGEGDGVAKVLFNKDNGKILGVHIIGMHAADLIQECSNAMAKGMTVRDLAFCVHTHPTLSEVVDEAMKGAIGMATH
eukprot:Plantae.Rhodophyta-Hildenbrandia_rubra.ctg4537.p1 GENE.Plantae.Rhodophyta-Hildenbrandia_rubra.ctg4537~~Plantae.Rhodophyta-Hildenbrandia_rubra.ctg4537.p1  ORF type:complete len:518 (+),score=97.84 Plantae.Rhodophyta-Hildenbrandia_rubra.ctg4537:24-1556(+)